MLSLRSHCNCRVFWSDTSPHTSVLLVSPLFYWSRLNSVDQQLLILHGWSKLIGCTISSDNIHLKSRTLVSFCIWLLKPFTLTFTPKHNWNQPGRLSLAHVLECRKMPEDVEKTCKLHREKTLVFSGFKKLRAILKIIHTERKIYYCYDSLLLLYQLTVHTPAVWLTRHKTAAWEQRI